MGVGGRDTSFLWEFVVEGRGREDLTNKLVSMQNFVQTRAQKTQ